MSFFPFIQVYFSATSLYLYIIEPSFIYFVSFQNIHKSYPQVKNWLSNILGIYKDTSIFPIKSIALPFINGNCWRKLAIIRVTVLWFNAPNNKELHLIHSMKESLPLIAFTYLCVKMTYMRGSRIYKMRIQYLPVNSIQTSRQSCAKDQSRRAAISELVVLKTLRL